MDDIQIIRQIRKNAEDSLKHFTSSLEKLEYAIKVFTKPDSLKIFDLLCGQKACEIESVKLLKKHLKRLDSLCEGVEIPVTGATELLKDHLAMRELIRNSPFGKMVKDVKKTEEVVEILKAMGGFNGI